MRQMKEFNSEINKVALLVEEEIIRAEEGLTEKSIAQLEFILGELCEMKEHSLGNVRYTRMIIDSWDYHDELGLKLLAIARKYSRYVESLYGRN